MTNLTTADFAALANLINDEALVEKYGRKMIASLPILKGYIMAEASLECGVHQRVATVFVAHAEEQAQMQEIASRRISVA